MLREPELELEMDIRHVSCGVHVHVVHVYRPQGRAQGLTPKGKLFMGVSSMWVGVVNHFSGEYYEYTMGTLI